MTAKSARWHDYLINSLKNPDEAAGYLNTALEDGDFYFFLVALRNVAEAQGGLTKLSRLTNLNRSNLYRMLSKQGRPELPTFLKVLDTLGLTLTISAKKNPRKFKKAA
jgi:probable addiction module antidote protein